MQIEIKNIQPIVVDVLKNQTANAISWQFNEPYRLGSDSQDKTLIVEFFNKKEVDGKYFLELLYQYPLDIPSEVLMSWGNDSVITDYVISQIDLIEIINE